MTLNDVLQSLLDPEKSHDGVRLVGWQEMLDWPSGALELLQDGDLLGKSATAQSLECWGCEKHCFEDVHRLTGSRNQESRAFIICQDADMQEQMGTIPIPLERLKQWKITPIQLAGVVGCLLATESEVIDKRGQQSIRLGMLRGKKGRHWISLDKPTFTLEVNGHQLPLSEVLYFEEEVLAIDQPRIQRALDRAAPSKPSRSTTTNRLEARKQTTSAMHEDWQAEYRKLRKQYQDTNRHPDTWIASKIARMDIGQGRKPGTIRRVMKG